MSVCFVFFRKRFHNVVLFQCPCDILQETIWGFYSCLTNTVKIYIFLSRIFFPPFCVKVRYQFNVFLFFFWFFLDQRHLRIYVSGENYGNLNSWITIRLNLLCVSQIKHTTCVFFKHLFNIMFLSCQNVTKKIFNS